MLTKYEPMDVSTSWLLFVLTMIIYVSTFIVLQTISEKFRIYMDLDIDIPNAQITRGIIQTKPADGEDNKEINSDPIPGPITSDGKKTLSRFKVDSKGCYRELHETLDVSIFR